MDSLEPGVLVVARYRLEEPLAADLSGVQPWAATDQILDRPVRVSLIEGPDAALTLDAARRAALISDPRLTRVLDVLQDNGRDYVVTEPYAGVCLADLVERSPLSARAARAVIGDAAKALEAARRRGVHHGALRPSAIRIHKGAVRVTGLGIDGTLGHAPTPATGDVASREDTVGLVALLHYTLTGVLPLAVAAAVGEPRFSAAQYQGPGDVLAPPREVVPDVPNDLDTLCVVTLGPHDDGPHTPGELVKELEPWDSDDVPTTVDDPAHASAPADEPVTGTGVTRQSVRAFGSGAAPSAGATMPGTPPPAGPVRRQSTGRIPRVSALGAAPVIGAVGAVGAVTAAAVATVPVAAAPGSAVPSPPGPTQPADASLSTTERAKRFHFNPTPVVLVLMLGVLVVGGITAKNTLFSGYTPAIVQPEGRPDASGEETAQTPVDPTDQAPVVEETPAPASPVILAGEQIALPGNTPDDHPELAAKAIDRDVVTAWYTRTYKTPNFGGYTHGVGFLVTLEQAAPVSTIYLSTNNTGGNVEIRSTNASDPTGGTLLASGPLQLETTFKFEAPVQTSTIVIWFTELPQVPTGENRANIFEIDVS